MVDVVGGASPGAERHPEDLALMDPWDGAEAATWNRHLSALTSFAAWAQHQEPQTADDHPGQVRPSDQNQDGDDNQDGELTLGPGPVLSADTRRLKTADTGIRPGQTHPR